MKGRMVLGVELFFSLMNNLALFIALVCLYGYILIQFKAKSWLRQQAVIGVLFGVFAMVCMHAKIPVYEGVFVDQRNAIVALSGAFGGPVSALVAGLIAGNYRVYLGGSGVPAGLIGLCLSAGAGLVLNRMGGAFFSVGRSAASAAVATVIIIPGFLFVGDLHTGWDLLKAMAIPYGGSCFATIFLAGMLLKREEDKHAEELAFKETKERLELALSAANEGLWDWKLGSDVLHFDDRFYTVFGYTPGEFPMALAEWEKRVHPDDIGGVMAEVKEYLAGRNKVFDVEYRFLHKSGDYVWAQGKGKVVARDRTGAPKRFIGTHLDISERKETERSLRITRVSFDAAAIGIYLMGPDGSLLDANRHAEDMLGYAVGELVGKSLFDIDAHARQEDWEASWATLGLEKQDHFERVHRHKDGRHIPVEVSSTLLEYENMAYALAFVKDVSRRKQTEQQVKDLKNYLASIVESMPSILICLDSGCRATLWNKQAETVMAIRGVANVPVEQMFPFLAAHMDTVKDSFHTRTDRHLLKIPFEWDANTPGYADMTIFPLKAQGIDGAVIRIDDVTEKVRMEQALIQNEKMLSIGGMAAGMAHEINNPLAGVIQNASVLSNRLSNTTIPANLQVADDLGISMETIERYMARRKIPEMIRSIRSAGMRMADIVENMLSFARKNETSFSSHDPGELMDSILVLAATDYDLKKHYDFKSIAIEKHYEPDLPLVPCEKGGIQQVILNVLVNGAHAMFEDHGPEKPRFIIRLSHEKSKDMIRMEIQDNGPGMEPAVAAKIFDPFFTTKSVGEGTGLGLSISYFIITENHQGTMEVASEPGKGSNFIICIPVEKR